MSLTAIVGWIGGVTGSIALIWDIYKWRRSGPRLRVKVVANVIQEITGVKTIAHHLNLMITVANEGHSKTQITHLVFAFYPTRWRKLRSNAGWIDQVRVLNLPYVVDSGSEWTSLPIKQTGEIVEMSKQGYLLCLVFHAAR